MRSGLFLTALLLLLATPAWAAPPRAAPTTWAELTRSLPKDARARSDAYLRFARDELPALAERRRAAREAARGLKGTAAIDVALLDAHLAAVAGKNGDRKRALARALREAKSARATERIKRLEEAIAGETALARLNTGHVDDAAIVTGALPAWLALRDERQHAAAAVALGRAASDAAVAERAFSDAVDALGDSRDGAAVRRDAWRGLATLFQRTNRLDAAAAALLAADRAAAVDPNMQRPRTPPYLRSRESAALCKQARDAAKTSCAALEIERWGERTFYDFSTEKRPAFDVARADDVLAEYESLLQRCMKDGARQNLTTNTHVELVWSVGNDGRVLPAFDLRPGRLVGSPVEECLRAAFAVFRYPPYRGEMQHVRLTFDVGE